MSLLSKIDSSWTLFLDRDGVINKHRPNDYVKNWAEFEFIPGALEAIKAFDSQFLKICIVTNQRGIGRELMSERDLADVHLRMLHHIRAAGGRIDRIYYDPYLADDPRNRRKPDPGMGQEAKQDFPEIDLAKSIMVGDSETDMGFGRAIGSLTIRIHPEPAKAISAEHTDLAFVGLAELASALRTRQ